MSTKAKPAKPASAVAPGIAFSVLQTRNFPSLSDTGVLEYEIGSDEAKETYFREVANMDASKKWTMPIRNWKTALNRFMIEYEDRLKAYVQIGGYTELFTVSQRRKAEHYLGPTLSLHAKLLEFVRKKAQTARKAFPPNPTWGLKSDAIFPARHQHTLSKISIDQL